MIEIGENMNQHEQPAVQLSSTYPLAPMDYVNMYTNENIQMGKAPLPPPIIKDTYSCFGKPIDPNDVLIRSLDQQGIKRLYTLQTKDQAPLPPATTVAVNGDIDTTTTPININNHKKELKKLNHSILIAYLDLLEILVKAPNTQLPLGQQQIDLNSQQQTFKTLRDQKLEDIELLFINMHHLINELRPHQARDNIRCILEMQKRQRLETADKFKTHLFKIVDLLKTCITSIKSSNVSLTDLTEINKSNKFIDELNSLVSSATTITKSLEKISKSSSHSLPPTNSNNVNNDVDMEAPTQQLQSDSNNNNTEVAVKPNRLRQTAKPDDKCDLNDLILCDLIDDFLTKENEF